MRSRGKLNLAGGPTRQGSEGACLGRQGNNTRLATQACTCGYLARNNVNQLCPTCLRYDTYGREVALRRMFGYVGYAQ
jgi:hypothetical protein